MEQIKIIKEALEKALLFAKKVHGLTNSDVKWINNVGQNSELIFSLDIIKDLQTALTQLEQPTSEEYINFRYKKSDVEPQLAIPLDKRNELLSEQPTEHERHFGKATIAEKYHKAMIEQVKRGCDGHCALYECICEQPTVNEDLLKEIDERIESMNNSGEPDYGMPELLERCKAALSQVKPSVWKKYPDEKPEIHNSFISYSRNCGVVVTSYARDYQIPEHFERNEMEFWCYEADLISTINSEGK